MSEVVPVTEYQPAVLTTDESERIGRYDLLNSRFDLFKKGREGIGRSSRILAQRPSLGVMSNPYGEPRGGQVPRELACEQEVANPSCHPSTTL
jgi:hypothetical protein